MIHLQELHANSFLSQPQAESLNPWVFVCCRGCVLPLGPAAPPGHPLLRPGPAGARGFPLLPCRRHVGSASWLTRRGFSPQPVRSGGFFPCLKDTGSCRRFSVQPQTLLVHHVCLRAPRSAPRRCFSPKCRVSALGTAEALRMHRAVPPKCHRAQGSVRSVSLGWELACAFAG